jgi:hypothetical protein
VAATGKNFQARVVGYDVTGDIALIQLQNPSGLHQVPLGDSGKVKVGDAVTALGNAQGRSQIVSAPGHITGVNRTITASDQGGAVTSETLHGMLQTDAGIVSGDSGGPLVNAAGQVIGMDTAGNDVRMPDQQAAAGFAIPVNTALSVAREIAAGHASSTDLDRLPAVHRDLRRPGHQQRPAAAGPGAAAAERQRLRRLRRERLRRQRLHRERAGPELLHQRLQPARAGLDRPGELRHPGHRHDLRQPGRGRRGDGRIGHHQRQRPGGRRAEDAALPRCRSSGPATRCPSPGSPRPVSTRRPA